MTTWRIQELVREGRLSPHDAALLLELRREIQMRRHWWFRLLRWMQPCLSV